MILTLFLGMLIGAAIFASIIFVKLMQYRDEVIINKKSIKLLEKLNNDLHRQIILRRVNNADTARVLNISNAS